MNSIGETLRRERLRHNLSLEDVARETRINLKFLEAIEAEDFTKLPGGVFARSFVRQYARQVGLDEEELAAEVQRRFQPAPAPEEKPAQIVAEPQIELPKVADWEGMPARSGSPLPALALVVVVMLVCSLVYAWWQKSRHPAPSPQHPPAAAQVSAPQPAPAQAPPPQPAAAPEAAPAAAPVEPSPAPAAPSALASAERLPQAETPASNAPVQVLVTADEPTWVSARSDGKFIYAGTLQARETKGLEANEQVRLVLGNAGGVAITLNGKPVPPLGPRGQVRTVQLSSGGVQIVPPKPREPGADPL